MWCIAFLVCSNSAFSLNSVYNIYNIYLKSIDLSQRLEIVPSFKAFWNALTSIEIDDYLLKMPSGTLAGIRTLALHCMFENATVTYSSSY